MLILVLIVIFMIGTFFGFMFIKNTFAHWLGCSPSILKITGE